MNDKPPGYLRRWRSNQLPVEGTWAQRRRLAEAMRLVIERLSLSDAPEEELAGAAERLEQYAEHLGSHPLRRRYVGYAESSLAEDPEPGSADSEALGGGHFDFSPFIGRSNPLSPPITLFEDGDHVRGSAVFGSAYEGPPGHVHGGYVAGAFDEVLGYVQSLSSSPGMTGRLTVHYRKPTPLHEELLFDSWVERVEGRKIFTKATLHAGDTLCAEAEGLFISIKPGTFAGLVAKRQERDGASD
ncbi:MAG: PaaI family thioesterase [Myxococcota bacterium]|nr:PaaI family thioesterase [Myxococcota bacterium]